MEEKGKEMRGALRRFHTFCISPSSLATFGCFGGWLFWDFVFCVLNATRLVITLHVAFLFPCHCQESADLGVY